MFVDILEWGLERLNRVRTKRRWEGLKRMGMVIGRDVTLPASTWVDTSHCYLISIGDRVRFGEGCLLLSHDAQMDEFLDAGRLGRVLIHEDCQIGPRVTILPNVEIGPRTVVLAQSVVLKSLPPDTVCAGQPAKPVSSLEEYLETHRKEKEALPTLDQDTFGSMAGTVTGRAQLRQRLENGGYLVRSGRGSESEAIG